MSQNSNESRLPPPAFPPGQRRHAHRTPVGSELPAPRQAPDTGFIEPDDPLPARRDPVGQAFISPDEPIPQRKIELAEAFREYAPIEPGEVGEVVGMDLDPHLDPSEVMAGGDPHLIEMIAAVGNLAERLKRKGESGLRSTSDMSRFGETLRAYCVGYLAGRRAEGRPSPALDPALPSDG